MKYLVFQREEAPDTKKQHWQGYVILKNPAKIKQVQEWLDCKDVHMEKSIASNAEKAAAYCKKEQSRVAVGKEYGTLVKEPGKRTDLLAVAKLIKEGAGAEKIFDTLPVEFIKYHRGIERAIELKDKVTTERKLLVQVFWGSPGTGKSRRAHLENPLAYWKPAGHWWDRYEGQLTVIWDDFNPANYSREEFLRITDIYPLILPVKGRTTYMKATKIVITSNYDPGHWFMGDEAVKRRLHEIIEFK